MDKQTTIAFVLIGAILIIWLYMTAPDPNEQPAPNQSQDTTLVNENSKDETVRNEQQQNNSLTNKSQNDTVVNRSVFIDINKPEEIITIENDVLIAELSTKGANFKKLYLKKFNNWYSAGEGNGTSEKKHLVQLINYTKGNSYDIAFVSSDGKAVNTGEINFSHNTLNKNYTLQEKDSLQIDFTYELSPGKSLVKSYLFHGDKYLIKSDVRFNGLNNLISNNTYDVVWNNGIRQVERNTFDEANYSDAVVYYGDEAVSIDASSAGEKEIKEFRGKVKWVAMRNKYFASIIIPENIENIEGAYIEGTRSEFANGGVKEFYDARLTLPFKNTLDETHSFNLFLGPVDYDMLLDIDKSLVSVINFGSFMGLTFIIRPISEYILLPLFKFLHGFIPNYGIVIIVFSLIIKIVVYPLTKKSYQSMKRMQALQPKITELKEKFKEDPQKMNKETMKLYSTYGVNPAGGCLPILLQMPIFIALWGMFQSAIDLRQQPFIWWIKDLSGPDIIYNLGFKLPLFGIQEISGLAILMGVTTFVSQKMTMKDPKQQALVYIMPVMLTILFMTFPSGLNLYYFMFNVLSIGQQYYINHTSADVELVAVPNADKKKGFMQRMMESAEQQAKQKQKRKK